MHRRKTAKCVRKIEGKRTDNACSRPTEAYTKQNLYAVMRKVALQI